MDELAHSQLEAAKGTSWLRTAEQMQPVAAAPQQQGMMMAAGDDMDDDLSARCAARGAGAEGCWLAALRK